MHERAPIQHLHTDAERTSHARHRHALVGIQKLRIALDAHLPVEEERVGGKEPIALQQIGDLDQCAQESAVVALVQGVQQVTNSRELVDDCEDFRGLHNLSNRAMSMSRTLKHPDLRTPKTYLLLELQSIQSKHRRNHAVEHKLGKRECLGTCECRHGIKKTQCSLAEVALGE